MAKILIATLTCPSILNEFAFRQNSRLYFLFTNYPSSSSTLIRSSLPFSFTAGTSSLYLVIFSVSEQSFFSFHPNIVES